MDTKRITTFLVGTVVGAAVGGTAALAAPAQSPVATAPAPARIAAATATARPIHAPARKSLVVVMPDDRDYLASSTIPVAGMAFGRPHGPRVGSVRVELLVDGRLIDQVDLDVHSSRFAGILELPAQSGRTTAELRVSVPARPTSPSVVRRVTIGAAARTHR